MRLPVLEKPVLASEASEAVARNEPLRDPFGRGIGYLRLSLTAACAMRCTYCRPGTFDNPRGEDRLSPDEIESLVSHLASAHGLRKVRVTGGDPTSRPELVEILQRIASVPGIEDLAMTTNALTLARRASDYAVAGLQRVNISLDTLDRQRFAKLTGVEGLDHVLRGLEAAQAAGLGPIKLNTVVVRGNNEQDLPSLVRFAASHGYETRFIELMPMGPLAESWAERYVPEAEMRRIIEPIVDHWEPLPQGADAAHCFRATLHDGQQVKLGFITPMSCNFCDSCNRIRVAADGTLYPCLMDRPGPSLAPALRPVFDGEQLDELVAAGLNGKRSEHPHDGHAIMTQIGG